MKGIRIRLDHHYQALETGALELSDVALRIKELRTALASLEEEELSLAEKQESDQRLSVDAKTILQHAANLRKTLGKGTFEERKQFLEGIVKEIRVGPSNVDIEYRLPRPQERTEDIEPSVLHSFTSGGGDRIRTDSLPRARRALSRLELHPQCLG